MTTEKTARGKQPMPKKRRTEAKGQHRNINAQRHTAHANRDTDQRQTANAKDETDKGKRPMPNHKQAKANSHCQRRDGQRQMANAAEEGGTKPAKANS